MWIVLLLIHEGREYVCILPEKRLFASKEKAKRDSRVCVERFRNKK